MYPSAMATACGLWARRMLDSPLGRLAVGSFSSLADSLADPEPTVAVAFQLDLERGLAGGFVVAVGEQIHQTFEVIGVQGRRAGLGRQVVQREHGAALSIAAVGEDARLVHIEDAPRAPAQLGAF